MLEPLLCWTLGRSSRVEDNRLGSYGADEPPLKLSDSAAYWCWCCCGNGLPSLSRSWPHTGEHNPLDTPEFSARRREGVSCEFAAGMEGNEYDSGGTGAPLDGPFCDLLALLVSCLPSPTHLLHLLKNVILLQKFLHYLPHHLLIIVPRAAVRTRLPVSVGLTTTLSLSAYQALNLLNNKHHQRILYLLLPSASPGAAPHNWELKKSLQISSSAQEKPILKINFNLPFKVHLQFHKQLVKVSFILLALLWLSPVCLLP